MRAFIRSNYLILPLVAILLVFSSCKKDKTETAPKSYDEFADELRDSPESLVLGGNHLQLDAGLYRNFMPVTDGSAPLICHNKLFDSNLTALDESITLIKQHVIIGDEVWTENYEEIQELNEHSVTGVIRNGPLLEPGTHVDIVCEFLYNGLVYRMIGFDRVVQAVY